MPWLVAMDDVAFASVALWPKYLRWRVLKSLPQSQRP